MDREEFLKAIGSGPVEVRMNDGQVYSVEEADQAIVSDIAAHVLYRREDGKLGGAVLPLVTMSGISPQQDS